MLLQDRVELENEGNIPEDDKYELNANHSHYIVIKDNTVSKTGINLFALRIIQYLSTVGGKAEFMDTADASGIRNKSSKKSKLNDSKSEMSLG